MLDERTKKYLILGSAVIFVIYITNKWLHNLPKPLPADLEKDTFNKDILLKKGDKGAEVAQLQKLLIGKYNQDLGKSGVNKDGVDGTFGTETENALKKVLGVTQIKLSNV